MAETPQPPTPLDTGRAAARTRSFRSFLRKHTVQTIKTILPEDDIQTDPPCPSNLFIDNKVQRSWSTMFGFDGVINRILRLSPHGHFIRGNVDFHTLKSEHQIKTNVAAGTNSTITFGQEVIYVDLHVKKHNCYFAFSVDGVAFGKHMLPPHVNGQTTNTVSSLRVWHRCLAVQSVPIHTGASNYDFHAIGWFK